MEAMVEPRPMTKRDTDRRSSLAESVISIRAERKSGPSSSDSSKNSIPEQDPDTRDGTDSIFQARFGNEDDRPNDQTQDPGDDAEAEEVHIEDSESDGEEFLEALLRDRSSAGIPAVQIGVGKHDRRTTKEQKEMD